MRRDRAAAAAIAAALALPAAASDGAGGLRAAIAGYLGAAGAEDGGGAEGGPGAADPATAACLACHGPFEALRARTSGWVSPAGIPLNPHLTFDARAPRSPHATGEGLIACTTCHAPHPPDVTFTAEPAGIDWCLACHHTATFRPCSACH